jgi:hypothetical protein
VYHQFAAERALWIAVLSTSAADSMVRLCASGMMQAGCRHAAAAGTNTLMCWLLLQV